MPELKLEDNATYCLPATIDHFRTASFVEELSEWNKCNSLTVYEDVIGSRYSRYDEKETGPATLSYPLYKDMNGKKLIYEIKNIRVDTALLGKCRVRDTVRLAVSEPRLKVLGSDTLKYPWKQFAFARVRDNNLVDTADLVPSSLQWRLVPDGKNCGTGLYDGAYNLTDEDRTEKDTLKFEISARSYCGDELKDTLYVELIRLKIHGYQDFICSNEEGYPLWDKVQASYADKATVQWRIVWPLENRPDRGELIGGDVGSGVKYKPGDGTDSVRIWFQAALEGVPDEKLHDTVVLIVNPEPRLRFTRDTLWACNQRIDLAKIGVAYLDTAHIKGIYRGDWVYAPGETKSVGRWAGDDYTFSGNLYSDDYKGDLFQRV